MSEYQIHRITLMTTDPLHIGAGGYRLGRVDNTIVREPGTRVPKIPGTALSGAARSYAARRYTKLQCAGQGQKENPHCGENTCPICYTFGSLRGEAATAGTVSLSDAQVTFFPVHSMAGPLWTTTTERLKQASFQLAAENEPGEEQALLSFNWTQPINFGWLVLQAGKAPAITAPAGIAARPEWKLIEKRVAIVSEALFGAIVNSNLEVRTSVSIDPFSGAAKSGALFTYEAIPRGAWLTMEIVEDDFRSGPKPWGANGISQSLAGQPLGETWNSPYAVAKGGLALAEWLGVGGMGTRGFGRIKILAETKLSA